MKKRIDISNYRYGGRKYYQDGGAMKQLTEFNEGGRHEENGLGGIPQGINPEGQLNLVEEGETKFDASNYIFSDTLKVNKEIAEEFNLSPKTVGKTFAAASKIIGRTNSRREGDAIEEAANNKDLENLMNAQEKFKQDKVMEKLAEIDALDPNAIPSLLGGGPGMGGQMEEASMMEQEAMMAQQGGLSPEEMAMMQNQMMGQQEGMMRGGGVLYNYMYGGGDMNYGYGGNINEMATGGEIISAVGSGLYGLGEGVLDTVTFGLTDELTDKGYEFLQEKGPMKGEDNVGDAIRGGTNLAGAVIGAGVTGGAATGSAVTQGSKGVGDTLEAIGEETGNETWSKIGQGVEGAGQIAGMVVGGGGAGSAAGKAGTTAAEATDAAAKAAKAAKFAKVGELASNKAVQAGTQMAASAIGTAADKTEAERLAEEERLMREREMMFTNDPNSPYYIPMGEVARYGKKLESGGKLPENILRSRLESHMSKEDANDYIKTYKTGGSTVNSAGNYTQPGMRKRLFQQIKAGSKGGPAGKWSARKAQLLAKKYKAAGGGYREMGGPIETNEMKAGGLAESQQSLKKWTSQEWDNVTGKKGDRYLPKNVINSMTSQEKAAENQKKKAAGSGNAPYSEELARKVRNAEMGGTLGKYLDNGGGLQGYTRKELKALGIDPKAVRQGFITPEDISSIQLQQRQMGAIPISPDIDPTTGLTIVPEGYVEPVYSAPYNQSVEVITVSPELDDAGNIIGTKQTNEPLARNYDELTDVEDRFNINLNLQKSLPRPINNFNVLPQDIERLPILSPGFVTRQDPEIMSISDSEFISSPKADEDIDEDTDKTYGSEMTEMFPQLNIKETPLQAALKFAAPAYNLGMGLFSKPKDYSPDFVPVEFTKLDSSQALKNAKEHVAGIRQNIRKVSRNPQNLQALALTGGRIAADIQQKYDQVNTTIENEAEKLNKGELRKLKRIKKQLEMQQDKVQEDLIKEGIKQLGDISKAEQANQLAVLYAKLGSPDMAKNFSYTPFGQNFFKALNKENKKKNKDD